jgi:hypothetical protein
MLVFRLEMSVSLLLKKVHWASQLSVMTSQPHALAEDGFMKELLRASFRIHSWFVLWSDWDFVINLCIQEHHVFTIMACETRIHASVFVECWTCFDAKILFQPLLQFVERIGIIK